MIGSLIALTAISASLQSTPTYSKSELSFYSDYYDGRKTASGQTFKQNGFIGAVMRQKNSTRPAIPFGRVVEMRYKGKTAYMIVGDTGSYRPRRASMWLDAPKRVFAQIAPLTSGRVVIEYRVLSKEESAEKKKSLK